MSHSESNQSFASPRSRVTRRSFVRSIALGAAAGPLILGSSKGAPGQSRESGEVVLDGLLITYFSAPVGSPTSSQWTFEKRYATTVRITKVIEFPDETFSAKVPEDDERVIPFSGIKQILGRRAARTISLLPRPFRSELATYGTPPFGRPEDTVFFGISRPVLLVSSSARSFRYRLVSAGGTFSLSSTDLNFGPESVESWKALYTPNRSALVAPRYSLFLTASGGRQVFTAVEKGANLDAEELTATASARILSSEGFVSSELRGLFAPGNHLEIAYSSIPEFTGSLMTVDVTLQREAGGVNSFYWDRVMKSFVIADGA